MPTTHIMVGPLSDRKAQAMSADHDDPYLELAALARAIHEHIPPTPADAVEELIGKTIHHLPAVDYAGVTLVERRDHRVRTAVAISEAARTLDAVAYTHGQGPCHAVVTTGAPCHIDNLTLEQRWPQFRNDALARTPVRSIVSYPLFATRTVAGVLSFYAESVGAFDRGARTLAGALAAHAAILWTAADRADQFQQALASRDMIGQAKGILMERYTLDDTAAFALLKQLSQEANIRLADIAQRLIDLDHPHRSATAASSP
jgi:transcriptional regulator with GAF, ATPase, and Fis domain